MIYEDEDGGEWLQIVPGLLVKEPEPRPEVPPEVWNDTPIDGARCVAATKALCG